MPMESIVTLNLRDEIFSILVKFDGESLNLMISSGEMMKYFDNEKLNSLNTTKWKIFYFDETCEDSIEEGIADTIKNNIHNITQNTTQNTTQNNAAYLTDHLYSTKFPIETKFEHSKAIRKYLENLEEIDLCFLSLDYSNGVSILNKHIMNTSSYCINYTSVESKVSLTIRFLNDYVKNLYFISCMGGTKDVRSDVKALLKNKYTVIVQKDGNKENFIYSVKRFLNFCGK